MAFRVSGQVASFLGSGSVLLCGLITNNMTVFSTMQWYCVLAACIAWLCMRYTGIHVVSATDKLSSHATASNPEPQDTPLLKGAVPSFCWILYANEPSWGFEPGVF